MSKDYKWNNDPKIADEITLNVSNRPFSTVSGKLFDHQWDLKKSFFMNRLWRYLNEVYK